MTERKSNSKTHPGKLEKNRLEWSVFGVSLLLLFGLLAYLVTGVFKNGPGTPDLKLSYRFDPSPGNQNRYQVIVENVGDETAEDVIIEASLGRPGNEPEKSELQVVFAPKKSVRKGWVVFSGQRGTSDTLRLRIMSYKKP